MQEQRRKQTDKQHQIQVPLIVGEKSILLLLSAEALIEENECANWCVHHKPGRPCRDCPEFSPAANGYILCDGYRQAGEMPA